MPVVLVTADDATERLRAAAAGGGYYLTAGAVRLVAAQVLAIQRALLLQSEIETKNRGSKTTGLRRNGKEWQAA